MKTHVTNPMRILFAALFACNLSMAAGIPIRTELAQIGTKLNAYEDWPSDPASPSADQPIVNGTPLAHKSTDVQTLDQGTKIKLVELINDEDED